MAVHKFEKRAQSASEKVIGFRRVFLTDQTTKAINNLHAHIENRRAHHQMYLATETTFNPVIKSATRPEVPQVTTSTLEGTEPMAHVDNFNLNEDSTTNSWDENNLREMKSYVSDEPTSAMPDLPNRIAA